MFSFPLPRHQTSNNNHINVQHAIVVELDIPYAADPKISIPININ